VFKVLVQPVVLRGGFGTWPLSRNGLPKQFVDEIVRMGECGRVAPISEGAKKQG